MYIYGNNITFQTFISFRTPLCKTALFLFKSGGPGNKPRVQFPGALVDLSVKIFLHKRKEN